MRGVAPRFKEQPCGVGRILLKTTVSGQTVHTVIDDVLPVSGASDTLSSMGCALDDEFKLK